VRLRQKAPSAAQAPEWEYVPEGWSRQVRGWDVAEIADAYRRRWPEFLAAVRGNGPLGVAHEVPQGQDVFVDDPGWHNAIMTFGYVLARACRTGERPSMLDWGGGPGHYLVLARALLPDVSFDYHSRDLPRLVELGQELLPEATFHANDSCLDRTYDLVVASDSLQYARELAPTLARLAAAAAPWLYVAQLPVAKEAPSFVVRQRPDAYGYETEYLGWVVNEAELFDAAASGGLTLEREFLAPGAIDAEGAPERPVHLRSYLFRRA
jgi:putative methyltransferase (TIGR04325 family)